MAFLNYGTTAGLAYVHDWDAVMARQNYNEVADRQAKIDAENKAKMLGEDLAFDHLSNTWDNKLMQDFAENRIREIGKFVAENPNYERDPGLWAKYKQMSGELKNNDIVSRSMRIQQNYNSLIGYMQQNPGAENDPAIQAQLTEYDNYVKYGSANAIPTDQKEFIFRNPDEQFDALSATAKAFSLLAPQETYDKRGIGIGATKTEVPIEAQYSTAVGLLNGPDGWRYNNAWKNLSETDKSYYQNDPVKWVMGMGSAYTAKAVQAGTVFAPQRSGAGSGGGGGASEGYSPYLNDFGRLQAGGPAVYAPHVGALLPIKDGKMTVNNSLRVRTIDANGQESWKVLTGYNGSILESQATGNVSVDPNGQPIAEVTVKVPASQELMSEQTPFLQSDKIWGGFFDWGSFEADDYKVTPGMEHVVSMEKGADGENTGYVYMKTWIPTSADSGAIRNYDMVASGMSNANKAEGVAIQTMSQQELVSRAVSMGGSGIWATNEGQYVTQKPDGKYYYISTGEEYK